MRPPVIIICICCAARLFAGIPEPDTNAVLSVRLDSIIVRADKFEVSAKNSPALIEVLDEARISAANGERLSDVLKSANSIFIKSYGPSPQLQSVSINGLGTEHTVILLDGVKLNSSQNAMFDLALLPRELIGSIAILANGASSLYGSEAMGGVINILSKDIWSGSADKLMRYSVTLSGGSEGTYKYGASTGYRFDNSTFSVFFDREKSDGDYAYHYFNSIANIEKNRQNDAYSTDDFGFRFSRVFNAANSLNFSTFYGIQDKQIPGIETGTPPSPSSQTDKTLNSIISFESYFSENLFLKLGGNFQDNYENYQVHPILNSYYLNLLVSGESELHYKQDDFQGILAYNYTHATLSSNQLSSLAQRNQHAGTLAFESVFFDVIRFFPSIRADIIPDENKKVATYKLGVNIRPFPNSGFSFRGNYGKNFRMPTFNDMYWKEVGTKSLNPEFSYNIETGIRYENSGFVNYCIDGTLTRIDATDKIVWMPQRNGIWRPQNIAKSVSKVAAINANIEKTFPEKLRIRLDAGLLFTDSRKTDSEYQGDPTYNKLFPYIPVHTAKLSLLIEYNQVSANFFFTHTGNKYSDQENLLRMPQYNVIDGNIAYAALFLGQSITTRLEINNITDQDYQVIADYPMPLRTFTLSFTLSR